MDNNENNLPEALPPEEQEPKYYGPVGIEAIFGWIYLIAHIFLLPPLLSALSAAAPAVLTAGVTNVIYYTVGTVFAGFFFLRWLRRDYDALMKMGLRVIFMFIFAYLIYTVLNYGASIVMNRVFPDAGSDPNTDQILALTGRDFVMMRAVALFIGPALEEILFRGVVFGSLVRRSRGAAYFASIVLFAVYHVWQYALGDPSQLVHLIGYLPASIVLCWCYEESESLWPPILFHMIINAMSFAAI